MSDSSLSLTPLPVDVVFPADAVAPPPSPRRTRLRGDLDRPAWVDSFLEDGLIDVTICIANWNCRDLLRACLESLHDQPQGVRVETVVVDNASEDGAAEMVAREFPEVVLVRNAENVGFARANNQAAQRARGRYLLFLKNDTEVPQGMVGRLVEYLERHPDVGLVGPRLRDGEGRTQVSYRQKPTVGTLLHRTSILRWTGLLREAYHRYRRQEFDPESTRPVEVLMGAAMLLPREAFFSCGGWDEEFTFGGEDLDLSLRVGRRWDVVYHPEAEILHYGRVSTRQHIGYASTHMAVGFVRYLRKSGCSPLGLLAYKVVVTLDAPVQLTVKAVQYSWRRLTGRTDKANKSLLSMQGLCSFLARGLLPFWAA